MASNQNKQLTQDFIVELIKLCLRDKNTLSVAINHIKYQFLPNEHFKEIWKTISIYYQTIGKGPTLGYLIEQYKHDIKVLECINSIREADLPEKDSVFDQLESFIKTMIFIQSYDQLGTLYNENKKDLAFSKMQDFADQINSFSIKQSYYDKIFESHHDRYIDRRVNQEQGLTDQVKIPLGIHELDDITHGGVNVGDTFIALAQSGVGKTKLLRHIGVTGARSGFKMLHIQAEGSRQEVLDGYDATWSGQRISDVEYANIDAVILNKMKKAASDILSNGGEIFVEAYEQFNSADLQDVRKLIIDIEKVHGKLHGVILDYFELFDPGNGKKYGVNDERQRREAVANGLKNIANELKVAIFTCTQASTVSVDLLNNPEFVQTRYHISEFKGTIKPFSYFITMNQTSDEYKNNTMRLYVDKLRKYRGGQIVKIYQRYDRERFYDSKKTLNELYDVNNSR